MGVNGETGSNDDTMISREGGPAGRDKGFERKKKKTLLLKPWRQHLGPIIEKREGRSLTVGGSGNDNEELQLARWILVVSYSGSLRIGDIRFRKEV